MHKDTKNTGKASQEIKKIKKKKKKKISQSSSTKDQRHNGGLQRLPILLLNVPTRKAIRHTILPFHPENHIHILDLERKAHAFFFRKPNLQKPPQHVDCN